MPDSERLLRWVQWPLGGRRTVLGSTGYWAAWVPGLGQVPGWRRVLEPGLMLVLGLTPGKGNPVPWGLPVRMAEEWRISSS